MATATMELNKAYAGIGNLFEFPKSKTVSTIKSVVEVVTNSKTAKESKSFLDALSDIKQQLIDNKKHFKKDYVELNLTNFNEKMLSINGFFSSIDDIFDKHEGCEIVIDDKNMIALMENLKHSKEILEQMINYLQLWVDAEKSKESIKKNKFKTFTSVEDIISAIKEAA